MDAATTREEVLARATKALGESDWAAAKRLFSEALERKETPEALEGLASAAFFLDEGRAGPRDAGFDLEMTAIALDGLARVSQGEVAEGMARLDEATAAATAGAGTSGRCRPLPYERRRCDRDRSP
jgi:hypothetical protein